MSIHEQFAEDLALYALGSLDADEKATLENHLEQCASCRRELEQLRGDLSLLALSATGPAAPARSKNRLMEQIAREPGFSPATPRPRWLPIFLSACAAGLAIMIAVLWTQKSHLEASIAGLSALTSQQKSELEQADHIAEILTASDAMRVTVLPVDLKTPTPEGKAIYSRRHTGLIFIASNLHPLPAQKVYELWLIPTQGAPIPAGTFRPDVKGAAIVLNPPLPAGVDAKAFAITIEPEQGSSSPTMPIVMLGAS